MSVQNLAQPLHTSPALPRSLGPELVAAIQIGLIGGLVAILISLEGLVEILASRAIIAGILATGPALVFISFFLCGQLATGRSRFPARSAGAVFVGLVAGLLNSCVVAGLLLLLGAFPQLNTIFINMKPAELINLLTFGLGLNGGIALVLALGGGLGALAALLRFMPQSVARALVNAAAWLFLIALLQELLRITAQNWGALSDLMSLVFAENGFTPTAALLLFVLIFAIYFVRSTRGQQIGAAYSRVPQTQRRVLSITWALILIAILLALPQLLGLFFSEVLVNTGIFILLALGLNIVVGFAGLLDLGYVAFFAIGAYSMAVLSSPEVILHPLLTTPIGMSFWIALPFSVLAAVLAGVLLGIPVLRIRGDYLAIVTLGFGEIIRLLAVSDMLKPWLGDGLGLHGIPKPIIGSNELAASPQLYYLVLAGCLLVLFVALRVKNSRLGRAWIAVREDEDVAQAMGIDLVKTKLLAFAMGASFGGLSGAIFASKLQTIYPSSFGILYSINVLAIIIIGGMGSIPGVIVGALVLVGLPELLREFSDFRLMLYGAVLVLMMLVRPEGLLPEARRREELEEFKKEEEEGELAKAGATGT